MIEFFTIATTGNGIDFGDLTLGRWEIHGGMASATRIVLQGGNASSPNDYINILEKVEIATTGNAIDFGDMSFQARGSVSCSNGHGGL